MKKILTVFILVGLLLVGLFFLPVGVPEEEETVEKETSPTTGISPLLTLALQGGEGRTLEMVDRALKKSMKDVKASMVQVETKEKDKFVFKGYGVAIEPDGLIVTFVKDLKSAEGIRVLSSKGNVFEVESLSEDALTGFSFLKIAKNSIPMVYLSDPQDFSCGQMLFVWAWDLEMKKPVVSMSVLSGHSWVNDTKGQYDAVSYVSEIGDGFLFDVQGRLVGMPAGLDSDHGKLRSVISSEYINWAQSVILSYGRLARGDIGILVEERANEKGGEELVVVGFKEGSSAEKAGIKKGDVILRVREISVDSIAKFERAVIMTQPGVEVELDVMRGGKRLWKLVECVPLD